MPPIDYNIAKYMNPDESVFSKYAKEENRKEALRRSQLEGIYQEMRNRQAQQQMADDEAMRAEMQAGMAAMPESSDPYENMRGIMALYGKSAAKRGDVRNLPSIVNALNPDNDELRQARIADYYDRMNKRGQDRPDKVKVFLTSPDGSREVYVPREEVQQYLDAGYTRPQSEDPIDQKIRGVMERRGGKTSTSNVPSSGKLPVGQKAIVKGRKAVWNGSNWDFVE